MAYFKLGIIKPSAAGAIAATNLAGKAQLKPSLTDGSSVWLICIHLLSQLD